MIKQMLREELISERKNQIFINELMNIIGEDKELLKESLALDLISLIKNFLTTHRTAELLTALTKMILKVLRIDSDMDGVKNSCEDNCSVMFIQKLANKLHSIHHKVMEIIGFVAAVIKFRTVKPTTEQKNNAKSLADKIFNAFLLGCLIYYIKSFGMNVYDLTNGFKNLSPQQIACIFSCFTNVSIPEDKRSSIVSCNDDNVKKTICDITYYLDKYYELEIKNQLDTGTDYTLHYELIDYIDEWCLSNDEITCKNIIIRIKEEKDLFLGEFIKAILKINNIAKEFEKIADSLENLELLEKIKKIHSIKLKYVATNEKVKPYFKNIGTSFSYFVCEKKDYEGNTIFDNGENKIECNIKDLDFIPKKLDNISLSIHKKIYFLI